jgi:hypothetical protein
MEYNNIIKISWSKISSMITESKRQVRLILPSIHTEWVELLKMAKDKGVDIKVCLNNSEKCIRDGFGDDKAIQKLIDFNIQVNETQNNRISMVSVDNSHYLYFPTSRIFESYEEEDSFNAVHVDQVTAATILSAYFPEDLASIRTELVTNSSLIQEINNERLEETIEDLSLGKTVKLSKNLDIEVFKDITQSLKVNPPLEPDLKRAIEVYNLKVQFAELKFENGNIAGRRVSIPKKALPFESPELKRILDAGMKLFTDGYDNKRVTFDLYSSIQENVKNLRLEYLIPIKCRSNKSILIKNRKGAFEKAIRSINKTVTEAKSKLINDIDIEIENSKTQLGEELYQYFLKNPPKEILENFRPERIPSKCSDYVFKIINKMNFPDPTKMVEGMRLITNFYDLTWNDFSDEELLKEFKEKGILEEDLDAIRQLRPAFEVRK